MYKIFQEQPDGKWIEDTAEIGDRDEACKLARTIASAHRTLVKGERGQIVYDSQVDSE